MTSLNKAYLEALEVREYKTYWSKDDLILHEEMSSGVDITSPYAGDMDKDVQIISHIKHQEYETAIELINEQMNSILLTTSNPLVLTKCRMFGIVNLLLNIIGEMRSMYDLKFMEETNAAEVLLGCQSLQELKTCMSDIFNQMRDYIQQKEKDLSGSRIRAIMDFIKTNYNRPDMSITYLSQVFNKNESYISRSFKRHVGMGFLDYLHSLRIIEAKRLIKAGNNIKEVSVLTGYTNETTLIRAFKRYEGITPGKLKATESRLG
jgi:YesN/AraC family two-component response regulator